MDLETRTFQVELEDLEDRTVIGRAVPYNTPTDVGGYKESFTRGAFGAVKKNLPLLYQHNEPVGKITATRDADDGLHIAARISQTPRGEEVLTLLRDGVLDSFSVGFQPKQSKRSEDGTVVRTGAVLREVSVVTFPAYEGAQVSAVRSIDESEATVAEETVIETPAPVEVRDHSGDIAELRGEVADLDRRLTASPMITVSEPDLSMKFRSFGEWALAVAEGQDDAVNLYRAFTDSVDGATLGTNGAPDVAKNSWVLETLELLNFGRPTLTAFDQNVLPATGMTLEYPQIDSNSITTATQGAESEALTYGKLTLTSATSPVITAGAWTAMSFQAAQRSNFGYVSLCLEALVNSYSDYTNKYVVDILEAGTGYGSAAATSTSESWAQAIGSASVQIYTGAKRRPEFILAAQDVWLVIAGLHDANDRPNLAAGNPSNNSGSANLPGMTAGLFGLPVIVDTALTDGSCYIAHSRGIQTFESSGAPFRLSDQDIVRLTQDMSVYGYLASFVYDANAIVKVTVT
jgi:HK97 family phage prohead protease